MDAVQGSASKSDDGDVMKEMRSMQVAYSLLQHRMDSLTESVTSTTRLAMTLSASAVGSTNSESTKTRTRLLLFARRNSIHLLRSGHTEFSRNIPRSQLCPGNSVTQVLLKSKASDATLADFRVLTTALTQCTMFNCEAFPSEFYAMSMDTETCARIDLLFPSYFDLCEALNIAADIREDGMYKEKRNSSRQIRAVQVMGVDAPDRGSSSMRERRIILGRSDPAAYHDGLVHGLHQQRMSWSENSCDTGFEHRVEDLSNLSQMAAASQACARRSSPRTTQINISPRHTNIFRMTWMRNPDSASYSHVPATEVSGSIRTFFPAVVLRPRVLITSTREIFCTPINNRSLNQLLVSASAPS